MFDQYETRLSAMLRGAATLFDLSGTGVFDPRDLLSEDTELESLRKDWKSIGQDFREVMRAESINLQQADG